MFASTDELDHSKVSWGKSISRGHAQYFDRHMHRPECKTTFTDSHVQTRNEHNSLKHGRLELRCPPDYHSPHILQGQVSAAPHNHPHTSMASTTPAGAGLLNKKPAGLNYKSGGGGGGGSRFPPQGVLGRPRAGPRSVLSVDKRRLRGSENLMQKIESPYVIYYFYSTGDQYRSVYENLKLRYKPVIRRTQLPLGSMRVRWDIIILPPPFRFQTPYPTPRGRPSMLSAGTQPLHPSRPTDVA
eukprot:746193-Hanusia_phi.AAC.3